MKKTFMFLVLIAGVSFVTCSVCAMKLKDGFEYRFDPDGEIYFFDERISSKWEDFEFNKMLRNEILFLQQKLRKKLEKKKRLEVCIRDGDNKVAGYINRMRRLRRIYGGKRGEYPYKNFLEKLIGKLDLSKRELSELNREIADLKKEIQKIKKSL